jgi:hypothetical protein
MVNHTMARLWGAGSMLLNPGRLIDFLLDQLEELSVAMLPARAEMLACREIRADRRFD